MNVLIIGGTGLTGRHIVRALSGMRHEVTVFHRGDHLAALPKGVREINGDKAELPSFKPDFARLHPDLIIHMAALTRYDADSFVQTFRGLAARSIVISSADVYRAYGLMWGTEAGSLQSVPLNEESPLRTLLGREGKAYDKVGVEAIVSAQPDLPCTIIRYPAVFGPHDSQHRFGETFQRIKDARPVILLGESAATFRFTHAYSENVAHAVVLAATTEKAVSRVYNIGEETTPSNMERLQEIGRALKWRGRIAIVPDDELPKHLRRPPIRVEQHLVVDDKRIREELGWSEIFTRNESIRRTYDWAITQAASDMTSHYQLEDAVLLRQREDTA